MEIALVVPSYKTFTGNSATARRLLAGFVAAGHQGKIVDYETFGPYVSSILAAWEPDIVHAFHARRGAFPILHHSPLVVSLTGTDAGRDLHVPDQREEVLHACRAARALVVHSIETASGILEAEPGLRERIRVVPKGVSLPAGPAWSLRSALGIAPERVVFLLPGGLRAVKNQLEAIEALEGLDVELVLAGPELEADYAARVREAAATRPWVRLTEIRPLSRMHGAYADADVVLNTSLSEGMSNAILEAMLCGRPLIVSDIPANRTLVHGSSAGLLYANRAELRAAATRLRDDAAARAVMGAAGSVRARAGHDPDAEARAVLDLYRDVLEGASSPA